jgi:hypothetical protein
MKKVDALGNLLFLGYQKQYDLHYKIKGGLLEKKILLRLTEVVFFYILFVSFIVKRILFYQIVIRNLKFVIQN